MIITFEDLKETRRVHKKEVVVLVGGCFDLLHVGHVNFLERCRDLGDILIVSVSSDLRVRERKGANRPIIPEKDRATMLSSLAYVNYAIVAPNPSMGKIVPTAQIIHELKPDIFATSDERFDDYKENLGLIGTKVIYVPDVRLDSTTNIIERICRKCE